MPDNRFQGKKVSKEWDVILTALAKRLEFRLNSGRRTMAEQWHLYRNQPPLAAFPNPNAPHIMVGRPNHSLDVDQFVGQGESAVQHALNQMGLRVINDVPGEGWHLTEKSAARLRKVAAEVAEEAGKSANPVLRRGQTGASVVRLKKLLYDAGIRDFTRTVTGRKNSNRYNPYYSAVTAAAIRRFQRANGLPTDGVVGPKTWKMLYKKAR